MLPLTVILYSGFGLLVAAAPPRTSAATATTIAGITLPLATSDQRACYNKTYGPLVSSAIVNYCDGPLGSGFLLPSDWSGDAHFSSQQINLHFTNQHSKWGSLGNPMLYWAVYIYATPCQGLNDPNTPALVEDMVSLETCAEQFFSMCAQ